MSESSHSDLAQAQPRLPAKERRTSVRVSCTIAGSCEPIALPSASGPERQWFGEVRDVSAGGMLLVLPRRFEAGAAVMVELPGETEGSARFIPANVVRVAKAADSWALGLEFPIPLKEEEVAAILRFPS